MKKIWDDKNNHLLGTMPDSAVSRLTGVQIWTVGLDRRRLKITSFTYAKFGGLRAGEYWRGVASKMTDKELLRPVREVSNPALRNHFLAERKRRGLVWRRTRIGPSFRHGEMTLRETMVKAAFGLTPRPTLEEVGQILKVTRERVRMILAKITK